jgi:hypothetical protein
MPQAQAAALLSDLRTYVRSQREAIAIALREAPFERLVSARWEQLAELYAVQSLARVGGVSHQFALTLLQRIYAHANLTLDVAAPPQRLNPVQNLCRAFTLDHGSNAVDFETLMRLLATRSRREAQQIADAHEALRFTGRTSACV